MFAFWRVNIKSHENYPLKYTPENLARKITSQIIGPIKLPPEDNPPLQITSIYQQNRNCYISLLLFQSFFPAGN